MKKIYSLLFPNTCSPINHSSFYINFINQRARLPPPPLKIPNLTGFFLIYALKSKDLILLKYTYAILTCLCINLSTRFYTVILFSKKGSWATSLIWVTLATTLNICYRYVHEYLSTRLSLCYDNQWLKLS